MSDLMVGSSSNVRSGAYFIVRSIGECRCCRASTPVIALALGPEHETLSTDADDERGDSIPDIWETAACNALLFYVETLPDSVQRRLAEFSQTYRYACSAETQGSYWANHCLRCGSLLEDHDLFCEPDGAFLPMSGASTSDLELIWIDEPIEAAAGGYSCDLVFFAAAIGT
jgi:hypothetical protein